MKKLLLLFTFLSFACGLFAQVSKTINLAIAGTLSTALTSTELNTITNLTVTGTIDARDFKTMRDEMPWLEVLDLSEATIAAYNGTEGTLPKSIDYPDNGFPHYAFLNPNSREGKTRLTTITIPSSVTSIGYSAFYSCSGLTEVAIPSSVTSIEESAFVDCSGLITVDPNNPIYSSVDGVLYDKTQTTLIQCPISKVGNLTIPSSVISIGDDAFYNCSELTSTNIPSSVTSIGNNSFYRCFGLTTITIPSSVTSIGERAFLNCSKLTSITIPSVTSLAKEVFHGCSGLTSIMIPSTVTSIGEGAFYDCSGLTTVTIPSSVISIGNAAFSGCTGLTSVTIPQVTSIGDNVFYGCSGLTTITIPSSVTSIGDGAFYGCFGLTTIEIPSSVTSIGNAAFWDCHGLTTVTIPSSATSIGNNTFAGCGKLTTVTIPSSVTSIGEGIFAGCGKLTTVTIPPSVTSIGPYAFEYCSRLTTVVIPSSVTSIGYSAFEGCSGLNSIISEGIIPPDLSSSTNVFSLIDNANCILYVPLGSKSAYQAADQWKDFTNIFEKDTVELDPISINLTTAGTLSASLTSTELQTVTNLTITGTIDARDFKIMRDNMPLLAVLDLSGATIVAYIGTEGTTRWTNDYPANTFPEYAFVNTNTWRGKTSLISVVIPSSVTSIGNYAFQYCRGLTTVSIPSSVTSIGDFVFQDCSGLTTVTIPSSVTSIGEGAFYYCSGLTNLEIPFSMTSIGKSVFAGCSGLTAIAIPSSVTSIGNYAFASCIGLTAITIPSSVTSIGYYAFRECKGLTSITTSRQTPINLRLSTGVFGQIDKTTCVLNVPIGSKSAYQAADQWKDFTNIVEKDLTGTEPNISINLTTAGTLSTSLTSNELATITNLTLTGTMDARDFKTMRDKMPLLAVLDMSGVTIAAYNGAGGTKPSSEDQVYPVNVIPYYAFVNPDTRQGKTSLTSVVLPSSVTSIGYHAFDSCSGLTTITIPSSVTSIGYYSFAHCRGLITVTIPSSVTSMGDGAFWNCDGVTSITTSRITPIDLNLPFDVFSQIDKTTCILYVPLGSKSAYQDAGQWKDFINIVEKDFPGIEPIISINLTTAGSLSTSLTLEELSNITNLTITGTMDARDFFTMHEHMPLLAGLDLSGVTIVAYSGTLGTGTYSYDYPADAIPYCAFYNTISPITTFVFPSSISSIGDYAFSGCKGLSTVTIPSSVTSIGERAFENCTGLTTVTIPSSVTYIGTYAFYRCSGLTTVTIPSSVTSIGVRAFAGCSTLTVMTVDADNPNYSNLDGVLYNKTQTTLIYCPNGKTGNFTIPSSVTSIGVDAFMLCTGLTNVTIPSSLTSIGVGAFGLCSGLTNVTIPSSVTSIGKSAFIYCSGLTTVTIPSSVISIGEGAFKACTGLTSITTTRLTPLDFDEFPAVFFQVNKTSCTLIVPVGSKSAYQAADQWRDFVNIVEKDLTGIEPILRDQQLTVYPNPTTGKVKLVFDQISPSGTTLTVNDFTGKTILTRSIQNKEEEIDLKGNSPGVYLIRTSMKDFKVQKVILK